METLGVETFTDDKNGDEQLRIETGQVRTMYQMVNAGEKKNERLSKDNALLEYTMDKYGIDASVDLAAMNSREPSETTDKHHKVEDFTREVSQKVESSDGDS